MFPCSTYEIRDDYSVYMIVHCLSDNTEDKQLDLEVGTSNIWIPYWDQQPSSRPLYTQFYRYSLSSIPICQRPNMNSSILIRSARVAKKDVNQPDLRSSFVQSPTTISTYVRGLFDCLNDPMKTTIFWQARKCVGSSASPMFPVLHSLENHYTTMNTYPLNKIYVT